MRLILPRHWKALLLSSKKNFVLSWVSYLGDGGAISQDLELQVLKQFKLD